MDERSLLSEIWETMHLLDEQGAIHQEALAYERAVARQAYLHDLVMDLSAEVRALRVVASLLLELLGDQEAWHVWEQSCRELRAAPSTFRSPGKALILGDLDLLHLVQYTAAASATYRERRRHLTRQLGVYLHETSPGGRLSELHSQLLTGQAEIDRASILACETLLNQEGIASDPPAPA